jgi:hypothetical protein
MKHKLTNPARLALIVATPVVLFSIIILSCKRTVNEISVPPKFAIAEAKEWYYGTFKKTSSFSVINYASPIAPLPTSNVIAKAKYPSWTKSMSYSRNGVDYVEMPLVYNTKTMLLPEMADLPIGEQKRVAEASLNKVLFAKNSFGKIVVRTVTIVPTPNYAKAHDYDISINTLGNYDKDFSGFIIIKDWNEKILKAAKFEKGNLVRKMNIKNASEKQGASFNSNSTNREVCEFVWVPKKYKVCVNATSGDVPSDNPDDCEEWQDVINETQGTYELQCHEENDDPNGGCNYSLAQSCECQLYGLGCDGDNGGDDENDCQNSEPQAEAMLSGQFDEYIQMASIEEASFQPEEPSTTTPYEKDQDWIVAKQVGSSSGTWKITAITRVKLTRDAPNSNNKTLELKYVDSRYEGTNNIITTTWENPIHNEQVNFNHTAHPIGQATVTGTVHHKMKANVKVKIGVCEFTLSPGLEKFETASNSLKVY